MKNNRVPVDMYQDLLGNYVAVNDWIIYGYNLGRSAALKVGKVLKIEQDKSIPGRPDEWAIRVHGAELGYSGEWKLTSPGTLFFPNRTIRLYDTDLADDIYFELNKLFNPEDVVDGE